MITEIILENFKCFGVLEVHPKRITVFIGPNGTGKSSVLQALALLKQSVGADRIQHQGEFVSLSDPSELLPAYAPDPRPVKIAFAGDAPESRYSTSFSPGDLAPASGSSLPEFHSDTGRMLRELTIAPTVGGLAHQQHSPKERQIRDASLTYGPSGQDKPIEANSSYNHSLEDTVSRLLARVTGTRLPAEVVNMPTEGSGSNAVALLLRQLVSAEKGAIVLIEEPEIHLHPKAQADLAQVLAETAKDDDKQLIITTHSEHFAGRLLTLVAERRLAPDELAIYSFEKDEKGECFAKEIEVTDGGQVIGGLKSFFDTDLAEWDRYMKARMPAQ